jgi:hypothetical protein
VMFKKWFIQGTLILFCALLALPAYAVVDKHDHAQRIINRLGELEIPVARWKNHVKNTIANAPASDLSAIDSAAAQSGVTFSDLSIVDGVITITLNSVMANAAVDGKKIRLTPTGVDTTVPVDGNLDDISSWTCITDIVTMNEWGANLKVLEYLSDSHLANCAHDTAVP